MRVNRLNGALVAVGLGGTLFLGAPRPSGSWGTRTARAQAGETVARSERSTSNPLARAPSREPSLGERGFAYLNAPVQIGKRKPTRWRIWGAAASFVGLLLGCIGLIFSAKRRDRA